MSKIIVGPYTKEKEQKCHNNYWPFVVKHITIGSFVISIIIYEVD